jgi:hypothetical protein
VVGGGTVSPCRRAGPRGPYLVVPARALDRKAAVGLLGGDGADVVAEDLALPHEGEMGAHGVDAVPAEHENRHPEFAQRGHVVGPAQAEEAILTDVVRVEPAGGRVDGDVEVVEADPLHADGVVAGPTPPIRGSPAPRR